MAGIAWGLAVLLAVACGGPGEETEIEAPRPPRVRTLVLEPEVWAESIQTYGLFEAAEEVELAVDFGATVNQLTDGSPIETLQLEG